MEADFIRTLAAQITALTAKIDGMQALLHRLDAEWHAAAEKRRTTGEFVSTFGAPQHLAARLVKLEDRLEALEHAHTAGKARSSVYAALVGAGGAGAVALIQYLAAL